MRAKKLRKFSATFFKILTWSFSEKRGVFDTEKNNIERPSANEHATQSQIWYCAPTLEVTYNQLERFLVSCVLWPFSSSVWFFPNKRDFIAIPREEVWSASVAHALFRAKNLLWLVANWIFYSKKRKLPNNEKCLSAEKRGRRVF